MEEIKQALEQACKKEFGVEVKADLSRPAEEFGDYASNVALQLSKKLGKNPHDIATSLVADLKSPLIAKTDVAGPGFINIWLTDAALVAQALSATDLPKPNAGKQILAEYGDPNPFKEMHIGHAYSYIVGDSIASILESSGAKVERLSYHGDVGLHVAKAIWGMQKKNVDTAKVSDVVRVDVGLYYAEGSKAYESDAKAKAEIDQINQKIYDQSDPKINALYDWGKSRSFGYFDQILKDINIHLAERFYESESAEVGKKLVEQNIGKVFEKSDGAVVFKGEKAGLHTRVFITSSGLPTYETKDLGLAKLKDAKYPKANQSIVITAHEQSDYFKVMLAAVAEIDQSLAAKTTHLYHGFVSLNSGKMSSRTGEVYSASSLALDVDKAVQESFGKESNSTRNAAIKYGFLKHRLGSDIVYDVEQSISLDGNSGPYLQYAHARARSILTKSKPGKIADLGTSERSLARQITQFPEVVREATADLMPSHICGYLYELAQVFNRFYENSRVAGDKREGARACLVEAYADVLKAGLELLNIEAPDKI